MRAGVVGELHPTAPPSGIEGTGPCSLQVRMVNRPIPLAPGASISSRGQWRSPWIAPSPP